MSVFLKLFRRIFGFQVEHYDDNNDHISTTRPVEESSVRNLVRDHVPARTSPSNVGYSPHFQKSSGRTNDAYENSRCSSSLRPTFSDTAFQSSSKPSQISYSQALQSPKYTTPSSKPSQIFSTPSPPPFKSTTSSKFSSTLPTSSFSPSPLRTTPPVAPSKSSVSPPCTHKSPANSSPPYSKPLQSPPSLASSSSNPRLSFPDPASSHKPSLASAKGHPFFSSESPALKKFLCIVPSDATNTESKTNYVSAKVASPIYAIPEDIKDLIKKDIVPQVLKRPLCPSSYKSYFAALLHAEEYSSEKWSDFQLKNVRLELHEASIYKRSNKFENYNHNVKEDDIDDITFVVFEIDSISEKRPFLLSRDLVFAQPLDKKVEPFQGLIHRVVKSTRVFVEFGDDFHSQHRPTRQYNISFSFNRVCLKRAHQAIEAASDFLFKNFLFPECISGMTILDPAYHELDRDCFSAARLILSLSGSRPYLLGGPLSAIKQDKDTTVLSRTGEVIREAVLEAYETSPENRILICAPVNSTCDALTSSLNEEIYESEIFRANAAFREVWEVPPDILGSCLWKGECFTCPSLQKLRGFRIVVSTFMSSFRLHNEGITAGHFSHIFLVDASSAPEPEVLVALANFVDSNTAVVVTGQPGDRPYRVRSDIARKYGLSRSYFERLHELYDLQTQKPNYII